MMPKPNPRAVAKVSLRDLITTKALAIDVLRVHGHTKRAATRVVAAHPQLKDLPP